jgi:hypothetical protein
MKKSVLGLVLILFIVNSSLAFTGYLMTEEAKKDDVQGLFTLILYGGRNNNDVESVAILDLEGDQYTIEPQAPEFDYKMKKGLSAKEALDGAYKFISYHNSFYRSQLSRIIDNEGDTIGYELRPLYMPFVFGISDILKINYSLKDGRVKVFIKIIPSVEKALPERTLVS